MCQESSFVERQLCTPEGAVFQFSYLFLFHSCGCTLVDSFEDLPVEDLPSTKACEGLTTPTHLLLS